MARKKVNLARRKSWLMIAVFAGGLALSIAYWQYALDTTTPIAPAPRQLTMAAPPSVSPVSPEPTTKDEAAPATSAPAMTTPAKKAPARVVARREPPPATPAPAAATAPERVTREEAPAVTPVERKASVAPAPVATFKIIHDHNRGNFETDDPKAICVGELAIFENELRFDPREGGDHFAASWADVKDVGGNRFFGSGKGGFHIAVNIGGKYKNFNLAPESKQKAEAKQILDLLNSYTRRSDRTK